MAAAHEVLRHSVPQHGDTTVSNLYDHGARFSASLVPSTGIYSEKQHKSDTLGTYSPVNLSIVAHGPVIQSKHKQLVPCEMGQDLRLNATARKDVKAALCSSGGES